MKHEAAGPVACRAGVFYEMNVCLTIVVNGAQMADFLASDWSRAN